MRNALELLNRLKSEARSDWLSDSQSEALHHIVQLWAFPERITLDGAAGSGKTFLAWSAARALHAAYYSSPRIYASAPHPAEARIVIDNAPDDAYRLRSLMAVLQLNGTRSALLVTTSGNRLGMPSVHLQCPSPSDVDTVFRNLSMLDCYALTPKYVDNLWMVIAQVL